MNNIHPIWTPQDSIDTAHQFHMELHNAERGHRHCLRCDKSQLVVRIDTDGVRRNCKRRSRVERFLFSRSRFRRANIMDTIAVALLMILMALFGCILVMLSAPHAQADPDSMVYAYAATFGGAVCETLDEYPSFAGIYGIGDAIAEDGLTYHQAGQVIAIAAMEICPRHLALVKAFAKSSPGEYA